MNRESAKHIVLVGNGLHRALGGDSWNQLLEKLDRDCVFDSHDRDQLSSPLLFEALRHRGCGGRLMEMKRTVAASMQQVQHNKLHEAVMKLEVAHVLTTNYDYAFENSVSATKVGKRAKASTKRTWYSLFRYRDVEGRPRVWHIHGEANQPASIMLGFEHYRKANVELDKYLQISSVERIQDETEATPAVVRSPLVSRKSWHRTQHDTESESNWSWVDHMLTSNVHIFGLGLESSEQMLWHLLLERQNLRRNLREPYQSLEVDWVFYDKEPKKNDQARISHHKLLESFGVRVERVKARGYKNMYERVIKQIRGAIGRSSSCTSAKKP